MPNNDLTARDPLDAGPYFWWVVLVVAIVATMYLCFEGGRVYGYLECRTGVSHVAE